MTPPPLFLLQLFNALIGFGSMLTATLSVSGWKEAGWSGERIGLIMTLANLCYGGLVAQGGRLADHWGRAPTALAGAIMALSGSILAVLVNHPYATVAATMLGFAGPALFFPGCAGLFSDAEGVAGGKTLPLHQKVSRYNLGWAAGNCAAFAGFGFLAVMGASREISYACAGAGFLSVFIGLWHWRWLPPQPPAAKGDRAPHAALPRLTVMSRVNLFLACVLGMALITQVQKALGSMVDAQRARELASVAMTSYAGGYIIAFIILGHWTGWVLRPWRLWWCQVGLLVGSLGMIALAHWQVVSAPTVGLCGAVIGLGYGAAYTSSIYYSLRLPHGAARAAGLHETFLGLGNTMGPVLGGLFLGGVLPELLGLGVFFALFAATGLIFQSILIPGAVRLGARGQNEAKPQQD